MIDYKAKGTLIASFRVSSLNTEPEDTLYIIVAKLENTVTPYVVSSYWNGQPEWNSGSYFTVIQNAAICFHEKIRLQLRTFNDGY
jgi:hypothetical protein